MVESTKEADIVIRECTTRPTVNTCSTGVPVVATAATEDVKTTL
jgi:hypothetical protein